MGLLPPSASVAGDVRLDGRDLLSGGERGTDDWRWRDIATVFQGAMNALNPVRTVGWQITEPMLVHGTDDRARRAPADPRAAVAGRAAARDRAGLPAPAVGRDAAARRDRHGARLRARRCCSPTSRPPRSTWWSRPAFCELLARLTDELDLALVLVTHDLAAAAATCPRLAVMYAGRLVEAGPVSSIAAAPQHPYTRQLFAAIPDLFDRRPCTLDSRGAAAARPADRGLRLRAALRRAGSSAAPRAAAAAPDRPTSWQSAPATSPWPAPAAGGAPDRGRRLRRRRADVEAASSTADPDEPDRRRPRSRLTRSS